MEEAVRTESVLPAITRLRAVAQAVAVAVAQAAVAEGVADPAAGLLTDGLGAAPVQEQVAGLMYDAWQA